MPRVAQKLEAYITGPEFTLYIESRTTNGSSQVQELKNPCSYLMYYYNNMILIYLGAN
jgi:hypothetical protein